MYSYRAKVKEELLSHACKYHIMKMVINTVFGICNESKHHLKLHHLKTFKNIGALLIQASSNQDFYFCISSRSYKGKDEKCSI